MKPSRATRDGAWLWLHKSALALIRGECEEAPSAVLVYVALAELASDARGETFNASLNAITAKCGLSRRTVNVRLRELQRLELVRIARKFAGGSQTPSDYTLLTPPHATIARHATIASHATDGATSLHTIRERIVKKATTRSLPLPGETRFCSALARGDVSGADKVLADHAEQASRKRA